VARGLEPQTIVIPAFDERFELVAGAALSKGRAVERIDDAALVRDWHSDYAVFILRLAEQLRATPSDVERHAIIQKLEQAMEGP
jgi:hypothetical protein